MDQPGIGANLPPIPRLPALIVSGMMLVPLAAAGVDEVNWRGKIVAGGSGLIAIAKELT